MITNKKKALVDVSVLLVFFVRHDTFRQVFEQVRAARPSRLFLYQDGPREGKPEDVENIRKCREIAENIDWECQVYKWYQEKNVGVDPSGYLADTWAFSYTDKCIVLEDDVVPSVSFFSFCKEMLDRYEEDERIMLISGFNVEEITKDRNSDYFFSSTTFTWGWATWKRVVEQWDRDYAFLDDPEACSKIEEHVRQKKLVNMFQAFREHRASGIPHFETILISNQHLRRGLTIVPTRNMVNNVGVGGDSAHYTQQLAMLAKGLRRMFTMERYELDMENLKHPGQIEDHGPYRERSFRIYGWNHPAVHTYRVFEEAFYKIRAGEGKRVLKNMVGKARAALRK